MHPVRLALVLLVVAGAGVPAAAPAAGAETTAATSHSIDRTLTLSLSPERPGEIRVNARVDVPDGVTSLTAIVPEEATVTATDGFDRQNETRYEWDRTTDSPTITWRQPANRTSGMRRGAGQSPGYVFVDTGEWALVSTPGLPISFAGVGSKPDVTKTVRVDGSGVVGSAMAYLGPYEERERRAGGQRFRLVVPEAAELSEPPGNVLDSLGTAATTLEVGARDDEVIAYVAPTTVEWGAPGLQRGDNEFWVRDDEPLDVAGNIWLHEYVHTRQEARTTDTARWFVEGSAEYYAALLTLQQGRIEFATFRDHLAIGTRAAYDDAVMAERDSWEGSGANYWKGSLVAGAIDRQVRLASDRERTLADVYRAVNGQQNVSNRDLLDATGEVADGDTRRYARRYTTTDATPRLWNESQHRVAFRRAANVSTEVVGVEARGPYRNGSVEPPVTVVPGERVRLRVRITNEGPIAGTYRVGFWRDGERLDSATGELDPGASTTVAFETAFDATGEHTLAVGGRTVAVAVREPATPTVASVDAPATVAPDEAFTVTGTVRNDADRPAEASLPVTVDGEQVASRAVRLAPGETTTVAATVSLRERGEHAVGIGDATTTVRVPDDATPVPTTAGQTGTEGSDGGGTTPTDERTESEGNGPGFGVVAALVALAVIAARRAPGRR